MKRLFVLMNAVFLACLLVPAWAKGGKEISQREKPNQVDRQGSQAPYKAPPGVKHWHGASPDTGMTHLALSGTSEKNVEWFEKVSDEIYFAGNSAQTTPIPDIALTAKQQSIFTIAVFTSRSDIDRLKAALNGGLDAGLTVNEIKEVLVHLYAYCGFPRSLNAITAFMGVIDEREKRGIKDPVGRDASLLPSNYNSRARGTAVQTELVGAPVAAPIYTFAPAIDEFLKGHLFGDIFARDVIDYQTRELVTISALASVEGLGAQLAGHYNVGLNVGLTPENLRGVVSVLEMKAGKQEAAEATEVLNAVLNSRK